MGSNPILPDQIAYVVYMVFTPYESRENNGSSPSWATYRGVAQLVEAREKTYLVFAYLTLTGKGLVLKTSSSRASGVSVRVRE